MLQEHLLLAWPLFIFFLALTFYLYPEDYVHIHMQYLFWLTILGSPAHSPYALSTSLVPTLLYPEPHTLLSVHDIVTPYPYCTSSR
jgi:hypothetical protein